MNFRKDWRFFLWLSRGCYSSVGENPKLHLRSVDHRAALIFLRPSQDLASLCSDLGVGLVLRMVTGMAFVDFVSILQSLLLRVSYFHVFQFELPRVKHSGWGRVAGTLSLYQRSGTEMRRGLEWSAGDGGLIQQSSLEPCLELAVTGFLRRSLSGVTCFFLMRPTQKSYRALRLPSSDQVPLVAVPLNWNTIFISERILTSHSWSLASSSCDTWRLGRILVTYTYVTTNHTQNLDT